MILTITWFLAAVPKWGSEAIEKKALLFRASAWGIPGTLTIILLAMNKIEGDNKKKKKKKWDLKEVSPKRLWTLELSQPLMLITSLGLILDSTLHSFCVLSSLTCSGSGTALSSLRGGFILSGSRLHPW